MMSVGRTKLIVTNADSKSEFSRRTSAIMFIQSKLVSVTSTLITPPTSRLRIQMVEMTARRQRSVKMVKWVRGRTMTVHLTTDTAARCQMEHIPVVTHTCSDSAAVNHSQQPRWNLCTGLERPRHARTAGSRYTADDVGGGQRRDHLRHGVLLEATTSKRHEDDRNVSRERRQGHKS